MVGFQTQSVPDGKVQNLMLSVKRYIAVPDERMDDGWSTFALFTRHVDGLQGFRDGHHAASFVFFQLWLIVLGQMTDDAAVDSAVSTANS